MSMYIFQLALQKVTVIAETYMNNTIYAEIAEYCWALGEAGNFDPGLNVHLYVYIV